MSDSCVQTQHSGHLLTVTLNRPAARNALNQETIRELTQVFAGSFDTTYTRCVLLTGAGTEAFCAGADLAELENNSGPEARREFFRSVARLVDSIMRCPVPVVVAVHGFALAGGCGIVAASDIAVAADDAVFGLPEVGIGLAPMVVLAPLRQRVSASALRLMALGGGRINAERALEVGLVAQVVKKQNLGNAVKTVCDGIIAQGPHAVRATKQALRDIESVALSEQMLDLADHSALVSISAEAADGIASFRTRRTPSWRTT